MTSDTERRLRQAASRCSTDPRREVLAVLHAPILRILAEGRPATVQELASVTSRPPEQVAEMLRHIGPIERDSDGAVLGLGLTLRPTGHRVELPGRDHVLYAWCAPDALILPTVIGASALVTSSCEATGQPISVKIGEGAVTRVEPGDAVVSFVASPDRENLRGTGCDHQNLFASAEAATGWLAAHPGSEVIPVVRAYDLLAETRAACVDGQGFQRPS